MIRFATSLARVTARTVGLAITIADTVERVRADRRRRQRAAEIERDVEALRERWLMEIARRDSGVRA